MELVSEQGECIELKTAVDASVSNPTNRRNELMMRVRCIEEHAIDLNYAGFFYTLTAPSKYHFNASTWNGASPKETQSYMCKVWARARAQLKRECIEYFGIRVVEPHADATPHWHLMLFAPPEQTRRLNQIIRQHFCKEDIQELMIRKQRAKQKRALLHTKKRAARGAMQKRTSKKPLSRKPYTPFLHRALWPLN